MSPRARAVLGGTGLALLAVGYAVLCHLSNGRPDGGTLGVVLAIGPLLLLAAALAWRSRRPLPGLTLCAAAAAATYAFLPFLKQHFEWAYLIQQSAAYALLSFTFARTLAAGRTALCTRFARIAHGTLDPAAERYTRLVTLSWAVFFGAMSIVLIVLFVIAPIRIWSFFANFCALPLIAAMFLAEYAVRIWALPHMKHSSILEGVRAYMASAANGRAMRRG